jgi:tetratricopeptide (TPR) repeat protein
VYPCCPCQIRDNPDSVDPNILFELGQRLVKHGLENNSDRLASMRSGLLLMESAIQQGLQGADVDLLIMAKAYCKMWLGFGVIADMYYLERSCALYEQVMSTGERQDADSLLCYCRVLQYLNRTETALGVINSLITFTDGDAEYPSYLLYAGDIYKTLGLHEQAATQFFEATQLGPPRLFSKLEMMFIISRNIEESAKDKDEPCDDAYGMVPVMCEYLVRSI